MPILNLDDTQLYYETHGEGRPFLFNAATATWGELWKFHQVDDFSPNHRVTIFDQRGTGRSKTQSKDFSTERLRRTRRPCCVTSTRAMLSSLVTRMEAEWRNT
jgi:pimeloyl-ACP methyl ester carboxylesterase